MPPSSSESESKGFRVAGFFFPFDPKKDELVALMAEVAPGAEPTEISALVLVIQ